MLSVSLVSFGHRYSNHFSLFILGDHAYKQNTQLSHSEQMISALPDIQKIELEPGDDFVVLACDGIWNSKTNQQVVDFIRPRLQKAGNGPQSLSKICEEVRYSIKSAYPINSMYISIR